MMSGFVIAVPIAILALLIFGLLPLILGGVALGRINRSGGQLRGRALAIAAMILGVLVLLGAPVLLVGGLFYANFAAREGVADMQRQKIRAQQEAVLRAVEEEARRNAAEEDAAGRAGDGAERASEPGPVALPSVPEAPASGEPAPAER